MHKDIADKWVAALRSGKYKKGVERLVDSKNRYCCLGVLCEVANESGMDIHNIGTVFQQKATGEVYCYELPNNVMEWAGMRSHYGDAIIDGKEISLVYLNDRICPRKRKGFKYIADFIEKHWDKL